jgi:hypothetical protein
VSETSNLGRCTTFERPFRSALVRIARTYTIRQYTTLNFSYSTVSIIGPLIYSIYRHPYRLHGASTSSPGKCNLVFHSKGDDQISILLMLYVRKPDNPNQAIVISIPNADDAIASWITRCTCTDNSSRLTSLFLIICRGWSPWPYSSSYVEDGPLGLIPNTSASTINILLGQTILMLICMKEQTCGY